MLLFALVMFHEQVPSRYVVTFIGFVTQGNLVPFESAKASALHALLFSINPGSGWVTPTVANPTDPAKYK